MTASSRPEPPPRRTRRPLVILAILAAVGLGALGLIYATFFTNDAPERLTLSQQPTTPNSAATGATTPATGGSAGTSPPTDSTVSGTWKATAGSEAGYRVREKLAALPAQSDAVGRSPAVSGTVKVELAGGSLVASNARFNVDLTKLASNESRRDNRIRTDGLQTNTFPEATFVSTDPITLPAATASGQAVKAQANGDLTLHGVTKRVSIALDVRLSDGKGELIGSLKFPMSDFGIAPPSIAGFVTVDPDATLEFKVLLEKA